MLTIPYMVMGHIGNGKIWYGSYMVGCCKLQQVSMALCTVMVQAMMVYGMKVW